MVLFLDESYMADPGQLVATDAEEGAAPAKGGLLTKEQRLMALYRMLVWLGMLVLIHLPFGVFVKYYMTWIFQRINQHLRLAMLERAEHLSLKYHSDSRTGDAIYRVYQDSATITNVAQ